MTTKRIMLISAASAALIVVAWVGFTIAANVGFDFAVPRVHLG